MFTKIHRSFAAVVGVLLVLVSGVAPVAAQTTSSKTAPTANGFRVSPVRSELTIDKGKSQTISVSVENPSSVAVSAKAVVNDFVASDDESGTPRLILDNNAPSPKNSFRDLVQAIPDVQLAGGERKDVSVKITVPSTASSGGYYGAIRFLPANNTNTSIVGLTASVGTIVLVTVPGNLTQKLDLVQLSAAQNKKPKSFITSGNVEVLTRLKNSGDIHVQPFGRVNVKNMFGKTVASYEFNNNDPRANILPGSTRKFDDPLGKKTLFGRYTIEANLGYSQGGGELISSKAVFWYVPTWALIALLVLVVAAAIAGYVFYRRMKRSHRRS